jgi:hypothetical protein
LGVISFLENMESIEIKKRDLYFVLGLIVLFGVGFASAQFGHDWNQIDGIPDDASIICTSLNAKTVQGCGGCGDGDGDGLSGHVLDLGEQCDDGVNNGVDCSASYGGSCNYCDAYCKIVTLQGGSCGDGTCNSPDETPANCNLDCPSVCGDTLTTGTEVCDTGTEVGVECTPDPNTCGVPCTYCDSTCSAQIDVPGVVCPPPTPACGNGVCESGEFCSNCGTDCGICPPPPPPPPPPSQCPSDNRQCDGVCYSGCSHSEDPDCGIGSCSDQCFNTINNNQNEVGKDCGGSCVFGSESESQCFDGIDNDKDCLTDCQDSDCSGLVECASGTPNYLAKQGQFGMVDSSIFETLSGRIGIGTFNPRGKLDIVGGKVMIGGGSPSYASGSGDLYVQNDLEVDWGICRDGSCQTYFTRHLVSKQSIICEDVNDKDGVPEICDIGSVEDYRYCALSRIDADRGNCGVGIKDEKWIIVADSFDKTNIKTKCQAKCLKTNIWT